MISSDYLASAIKCSHSLTELSLLESVCSGACEPPHDHPNLGIDWLLIAAAPHTVGVSLTIRARQNIILSMQAKVRAQRDRKLNESIEALSKRLFG